MRKPVKVSPSKEWYQMPQKDAVEALKHHKDDVDLNKLWESGQPKKDKEK